MEEAYKSLFEQQAQLLAAMQKQMGLMQQQIQSVSSGADSIRSNVSVPWPQPLQVDSGDLYDNLEVFRSNWENYKIATGINKWSQEKEATKAGLLLSAIGHVAMKKYMDFGLTDADKISESKIFDKVKTQIIKKTNVIYARYVFNKRCQSNNECFDDYLLVLRKLIKPCQYPEAVKDELLRDRVVVGIRDSKVIQELLRKADLDLDAAVILCRAAEGAAMQVADLIKEEEVNKITKVNSARSKEPKKCRFCAQIHVFEKKVCPAWGKRCEACGARNHFKIVCKKQSSVKEIEANEETSDDSVIISEVRTNQSGHVESPLWFKINNDWKEFYCTLDTGAQVCVMGTDWYKKISGENDFNMLTPTTLKLKCFNGLEIPNKGVATFLCTSKSKGNRKTYKMKFHVVDIKHEPLLSEKACVELGFIRYCQTVTLDKVDRSGVYEIMKKYGDVFEGHGSLPGEVQLELDESVPARIQPARRIPVSLREKLQTELDQLERDSIIVKETQHTDWVNNILIVSRDSKFRICLDPIPLNKALKRPNFQFTTLDEMLPELSKAKVFSTVDAKKGFWQCRLTETSSKLTTFWTPFGRYRWLRLPFGLSSSPEIFQQRLTSLLKDLKGVEVIADDILIFGIGDTIEEAVTNHNSNFEKLLQRLCEVNCKLNKDKVNLLQTSVKFYGHILTNEGLKVDKCKVDAIKNMPTPICAKDVLRFLGMIGYLSKFINNLSVQGANLRRLTKKNADFVWTKKEEEEFQNLKNIISNLPTLTYFDVNKEVTIECDASEFGLGAALYQDNKIISFASRCLSTTEKKYAQIEKEMLAIVFACKRFNQYIAGHCRTIVKTDHRPLINIVNKPLVEAPKRLQMMLLTLQKYNVELKFIQGKDNHVADTLSRAPIADHCDSYDLESKLAERKVYKLISKVSTVKYLKISDKLIQEIKKETDKDKELQKLVTYIINGFPRYMSDLPVNLRSYHKFRHELSTSDGLVFRNNQVLIPEILRSTMLQKVHVTHNGFASTVRLARQNIFWPGMAQEVRNYVEKCQFCAVHAPSQQKLPLICHDVPRYPFQYISMDVFSVGDQKFLVTVDHYSDYFELDLLNTLTSSETILICKRNFARHGSPQRVCTDNATNFVNEQFKLFANKWNFEHVTSSPHHAASNGKAEAAVKCAKRLVIQSMETKQDLWYILLHHRNIPIEMDGTSPVQKIFSRQTRTGLPCLLKQMAPKVVPNVAAHIIERKDKIKKTFDKRSSDRPQLFVGQNVTTRLYPENDNKWSFGTISKVLDTRSYIVKVGDKEYRRNRVHIRPFVGQYGHQHSAVDSKEAPADYQGSSPPAGFEMEYCSQMGPCNLDQSSPGSGEHLISSEQSESSSTDSGSELRRSSRIRTVPSYLTDYAR